MSKSTTDYVSFQLALDVGEKNSVHL